MKEFIISKGINRYLINKEGKLTFKVLNDSESLIEIDLEKDGKINLKLEINHDIKGTLFFINKSKYRLELSIDSNHYENSEFKLGYLELGFNETKLNILSKLKQAYANANIHTASICNHQLDYNIETIHEVGNTYGNMENYGLVNAEINWNLVCAGRINKGSKQSESHQTTRIMTFVDSKRIKVLPILYIDENDVIASHANTLGQPDAEALYYMESRGISKKEAISLITIGYIMPIIKLFNNQKMANYVNEIISERVH